MKTSTRTYTVKITKMPKILSRPDLQQNQIRLLLVKLIVYFSVLLLIALLVLYVAVGNKFFDPIVAQDEGILLVYPELILRGFMPGKDFATLYPPGNFYFLAGAFHLFGTEIIVERLVGFLYFFLTVVAAFFLGLQLGWITGVLAATMSLIALYSFPGVGAYAINAAIALALFSLLLGHLSAISDNSYLRSRRVFYTGILVGMVLLFRQDVAIITGLACTLMIGTLHVRYLKEFLLGVVLAASPFVLFIINVGWETVLDNLVIDVLRIGPGRRLPLYLGWELRVLLLTVFISFFTAIMFVCKWKYSRYYNLTLGAGVLSLGLLPSALQRADMWHVTYVGSATGALAVISISALILQIGKHTSAPLYLRHHTSLISEIAKALPKNRSNTITILLILSVLCLSSFFIYKARETWWYWSTLKNRQVIVNERWVPIDKNQVQSLQSLISTILKVAKPGDRLFVGPNDLRRTNYNDTFIYFLIPDLLPASYYLEMNPGSANRLGSRLSQDIASADIVVLTTRYDTWNEANDSVLNGDASANKIVENNFCLDSIHGEYSIYLKCTKKKISDKGRT